MNKKNKHSTELNLMFTMLRQKVKPDSFLQLSLQEKTFWILEPEQTEPQQIKVGAMAVMGFRALQKHIKEYLELSKNAEITALTAYYRYPEGGKGNLEDLRIYYSENGESFYEHLNLFDEN